MIVISYGTDIKFARLAFILFEWGWEVKVTNY
jgi:hypothetical protein